MDEDFYNGTELNYYSGPCLNTNNSESLNNAGIVINKLSILVYCLWTPIIILLGIIGNIFSIVVLKRQFAKENMYYFQFIIMIVEVLTLFGLCSNSVFYPFLFQSTPGPNFVKYNYVLSSFISIQIVINNMLANSLILIITATSLDRLQVIQKASQSFIMHH